MSKRFLRNVAVIYGRFVANLRYNFRLMEGSWEYALAFEMNGIPFKASAKVPYDTDWADPREMRHFIARIKNEVPEADPDTIVILSVKLVK